MPTSPQPVGAAGKTLSEIGIQPGWFVRYGSCSIWFEVLDVFDTAVSCVHRDPLRKKDFLQMGSHFSAINELSPRAPAGSRWIAADRSKSFFNKFYPERDKIVTELAPPSLMSCSSFS